MINNKFGSLLVLEKSEIQNVKGHIKYKCLCDCGNITNVTQNNLLRQNTTRCVPCGIKSRVKKLTRYDVKNHKYTYCSYRSMLLRCSENERYKDVKICDKWIDPVNGFNNFLQDMGERPEKHTLDRINNSLGYFVENCRWSTYSVQNHNKGKNRKAKDSIYIGVSKHCKIKKTWVVQFYYEGNRTVASFDREIDAAIYYDNLSEKYYQDRPNKTNFSEVLPNRKKLGGIHFCKKSKRFVVRITLSGKRKPIGRFDDYETAKLFLEKYKKDLET